MRCAVLCVVLPAKQRHDQNPHEAHGSPILRLRILRVNNCMARVVCEVTAVVPLRVNLSVEDPVNLSLVLSLVLSMLCRACLDHSFASGRNCWHY
jgi:hypothetical protein